jgi:hypothetical protein
MASFEVTFADRTVIVDDVDSYAPEGPMTTFFVAGSGRGVLDSWSVRVASFRTVDVVSITRVGAAAADAEVRPAA